MVFEELWKKRIRFRGEVHRIRSWIKSAFVRNLGSADKFVVGGEVLRSPWGARAEPGRALGGRDHDGGALHERPRAEPAPLHERDHLVRRGPEPRGLRRPSPRNPGDKSAIECD